MLIVLQLETAHFAALIHGHRREVFVYVPNLHPILFAWLKTIFTVTDDSNNLKTIHEFDRVFLEYHRLLKSLPRSNFTRPGLLVEVASLRTQRWVLSRQKSDFDKAITHLTEAVLLLPTQRIVFAFFRLSATLRLRFECAKQPDDLKFSIKYFRFLRINFRSLEALGIPRGHLPSNLFRVLAFNLVSTPGEMARDLEEMVVLIPELITADTLTYHRIGAFEAFCEAFLNLTPDMFSREDTQPVADRAIQVLRGAMAFNQDPRIAIALATCLGSRFETTHAMSDCEEAIATFDKIAATCSSDISLVVTQRYARWAVSRLLLSRVNLFPRPEYLEDGIRRLRTLVPYSLDDDRTNLTKVLDTLTYMRFQFFGISGNSRGIPHNPNMNMRSIRLGDDAQVPQFQQKLYNLRDVTNGIIDGKITNVEAAVERSRKLIPLQRSNCFRWSAIAKMFATILYFAHGHTGRSAYLNEAITIYRDVRKMSATPKMSHFDAGWMLHHALLLRGPHPQDFEELMQLWPELANDVSGEVFTRFQISCYWAANARANLLPSTALAYETAMSLLQETLVFCPTLQTQHHLLANALRKGGRFASDYASYRIENGQVQQAIETLERGRALIWSEMRGLRTSTERLRAAYPVLADKFTDINQRLEWVTMSVAQSDDNDLGKTLGETGRHEHSINHLVLTHRRLLDERTSLISHIQSLPGFEHFLNSPSFDFLNAATSHEPVIIVNQSQSPFPSHIILLFKDSPPFIISTPSSFYDRANQLKNELLRVRKEKGLDSKDYNDTLASVLSGLYELVGKPVIKRLRESKVPEKSRVWWFPTGAFCSLPLHAMGPIPSDDSNDMYFSDMYIPSYTPTLAALIESRNRGSSSDASDNSKPSILLVAQPETLHGAFGEIKAIEATKTTVKSLISKNATPETVIEGLRGHRFAHFVCHGLLETGKPFDASLELHKANLTLLEIVRSQLPAAEFAFLAACHTAELTEDSVADEGLHLAAAMQYCGFRSVVGTMWAMADTDGADLSRHFYKATFANKADQNGVPYYERTAGALQIAVKKLRKKRGVSLERWVNFVHYGA